jgi:hypothetical protein
MELHLYGLMSVVLENKDAAIETGWSPRDWEAAGGFGELVRKRVRSVRDLREMLAHLGATRLVRSLSALPDEEPVEIPAACLYGQRG